MTLTRRSMIRWSVAVVGIPTASHHSKRPRRSQAEAGVAFSVAERVRFEPGSGADETPSGRVTDLDDAGAISGWRTVTPDRSEPLVWDGQGGEAPVETGRFGGTIYALSATGYAAGAEHLAPGGKVMDAGGYPRPHTAPRLWRDGAAVNLVLPGEARSIGAGEAVDVSEAGVAVGTITTITDETLPVIWTSDGLGAILECPGGGPCRPWAIQGDEVIAGTTSQRLDPADPDSYVTVPMRWTSRAGGTWGVEVLPFPDTQPTPADFAGVQVDVTFVDLSAAGAVVVGYASHLGESVYGYDDGPPARLNDGFDLRALAMNAQGTVVGARRAGEFAVPTLVLWERGAFRDLTDQFPDLGDLRLASVVAINASNQILATASDKTGTVVALVFTPLD